MSNNLISSDWTNYKLLDAGNGEKLESWNGIILRRPDPQAIWPIGNNDELWKNPDGYYHRSSKGGGYWDFNKKIPEYWYVKYRQLTFKVSPTNFKHTGLFPEQAVNWDYIIDKISHAKKNGRQVSALNLFAYTGGATMAASYGGADVVVHVDASKGMTNWAKENRDLCGLQEHHIRFIVDDCLKFVEREERRGHKYDVIIMDPPSYGRGPNGEVWKFEQNIYNLISACMKILSDEPLLFLINSYTTGISSTVLGNILKTTVLKSFPQGKIVDGEIGLPIEKNNLILPCGIYGRWESND